MHPWLRPPVAAAFLLLAWTAQAKSFFPLPPVMIDSFGDPISSSLEAVEWQGSVQVVDKDDPVFTGSDLSGVDGRYFGLLGDIFVDVPTQPGVYHRVRYRFAGTDALSAPFTIDLEASASAFLGSREDTNHVGDPVTIDDLALLRSSLHRISMPGIANWRIHAWKEASLGFRATTAVTRIRFRKIGSSAPDTVAIDEIFVLPGPKMRCNLTRTSERNGRWTIRGTARSDDGIRKVKVWVNSRKARTHGRERWTARIRLPASRKHTIRAIVIDRVGDRQRFSETLFAKSRGR